MDKMVDHLFLFEGEGGIKDIVGNYTEYRKKNIEETREVKASPRSEKELIATQEVKVSEKRKLSFKEKIEFEQLEKELEQLEQEKSHLTNRLSNTEISNDEIVSTGLRLSDVVSSLEQKTDRWLELSEFL
jgi:ATP-binding cassette subfamily F protein uup